MDVRVDLAQGSADRRELRIGATLLRPSTRELIGPRATVSLEPRILQVLLALADAGGDVVTRGALLRNCWNGQIVGDDALNRAIAQIRKLAREVDPDGFGVETIAKTGYRLTGTTSRVAPPAVQARASQVEPHPRLSRRALVVGGAAAAALLGGIVAVRSRPSSDERRAADLLERGALALRDELPESDQQGVGFLAEAVRLDPENANAWGKLALAWRNIAVYAEPGATANAVTNTQTAARRALALDPRQGDALTALATLPPMSDDWLAAERSLRRVLALAPGNLPASDALSVFLMATGQVHARQPIANWLVEREPLSPVYQMHWIYGLWSTGRDGEADAAAARAIQLWPQHPAIWMARLWTLAFTGRAAAAQNFVAETQRLQGRPSRYLGRIEESMRALATRAPADVAAAVASNIDGARQGEGMAINAILVLSALGAVDSAFDVARGYLLRQGPIVMDTLHSAGRPSMNDQRRRKTMMLFVPATAPLRADPRFLGLASDVGLTRYWQRAKVTPDFLKGRSR